MRKSSPPFQFPAARSARSSAPQLAPIGGYAEQISSLPTAQITRLLDDWLLDCEVRQHSERTIEERRRQISKLIWHLEESGAAECGEREVKQFFVYLNRGHTQPGGRWRAQPKAHTTRPMRPVSVASYHSRLRTFFNWCVGEQYLHVSPMARLQPPIARPDQIQPFSLEEVAKLLDATKNSAYPLRDVAILLFLLDTGVRVSELCALNLGDVDLQERRATVHGKGDKKRVVRWNARTGRALWAYLKDERRAQGEALFLAERGQMPGEGFGRHGLRQIIVRLGRHASMTGKRCSPHTFRHTFAVEFLKAGGNTFALKEMLGHTSLKITMRYVALAEADMERQHRQFSPVNALQAHMRTR